MPLTTVESIDSAFASVRNALLDTESIPRLESDTSLCLDFDLYSEALYSTCVYRYSMNKNFYGRLSFCSFPHSLGARRTHPRNRRIRVTRSGS
jgi:hypothetical protein